jgi:hypothetical protein
MISVSVGQVIPAVFMSFPQDGRLKPAALRDPVIPANGMSKDFCGPAWTEITQMSVDLIDRVFARLR